MTSSVKITPKRGRAVSQARRRTFSTVLSYLALVLLAFFFLFPLVFLFVSAFKNDELQLVRDMNSLKAFIPTGDIGVQNYRDMSARVSFGQAFFNSSLVVSATVVLGLLVNSSFAYALARLRFRGRGLLLGLVVSLIIIPFQAVAIPLLLVVNSFGWNNGGNYPTLILPFVGSAFSIYLFYQFFISLPRELEEAAQVDGASKLRIYWSIILPLSGPVFSTVAILQFLGLWGNLLWPVLTVRGDRYATLPYVMQTFFGQAPRQWGDVMAFASLATLPTLILFLVFQRFFVRSVVSSGVKG